ncbi:MAG: hypothetical protein M3295_09865, partial [Chloroflexota bacterium]|nr:hypothetical protein [Chloroflexota bacterium]
RSPILRVEPSGTVPASLDARDLRLVRVAPGSDRIGETGLRNGTLHPVIGPSGDLAFIRASGGASNPAGAVWVAWSSAVGTRRVPTDAFGATAVDFGPDPGTLIASRGHATVAGAIRSDGVWIVDVTDGRLRQLADDGHAARWVP